MNNTKINENIYTLIPNYSKKDNSELLRVESAKTRSAIVQATIINKIMELKEMLPKTQAEAANTIIKSLASC